jgi:hypothetical protein
VNVGPKIGMVISAGLATMTELGSTLGTEDLEDLVEIAMTDAANARIMAKQRRQEDE